MAAERFRRALVYNYLRMIIQILITLYYHLHINSNAYMLIRAIDRSLHLRIVIKPDLSNRTLPRGRRPRPTRTAPASALVSLSFSSATEVGATIVASRSPRRCWSGGCARRRSPGHAANLPSGFFLLLLEKERRQFMAQRYHFFPVKLSQAKAGSDDAVFVAVASGARVSV